MTARVRGCVRIKKALGRGVARGFDGSGVGATFIASEKDFLFRVILSGARKRAVEGSRSMAWEVIWLEELKS